MNADEPAVQRGEWHRRNRQGGAIAGCQPLDQRRNDARNEEKDLGEARDRQQMQRGCKTLRGTCAEAERDECTNDQEQREDEEAGAKSRDHVSEEYDRKKPQSGMRRRSNRKENRRR